MTRTVPIENVHPNPDNPRNEAGDVSELSASIREQGILEDIIVRPAPEIGEDQYMILDGYRRWVAARTVLTSVNVSVRTPHPNENLAVSEIIMSLTTTLHRRDLGPIDRAKAYARLRDEAGMTQVQIARMMGLKNDSSVSTYLSLLELSPSYQKNVAEGRATVTGAIAAVQRKRAIERKVKGHKPVGAEWEPDHFTKNHHLAKKAQTMCDARDHNGRRRYGKVACGNCWETVIRQDEAKAVQIEYQGMGLEVPFIPPVMTASTRRETTNHKGES